MAVHWTRAIRDQGHLPGASHIDCAADGVVTARSQTWPNYSARDGTGPTATLATVLVSGSHG